MSDMMKKMSDMIKNNEIPDNIKNMLSSFANGNSSAGSNNNSNMNFNANSSVGSNNNSNMNSNAKYSADSNTSNSGFSNNVFSSKDNVQSGDSSASDKNNFNIDMDTMLKMKSIIDNMNKGQNDSRANLLRSLKPYLKPSRKEKVDQYIKLFSMGRVFEMMGPFGGEKKNGL